MHISPVLLSIWSVLLFCFVAVMVYRATLTQHETDQLFLGDSGTISSTHAEQEDLVRRLKRIAPACYGLGIATAIMTIVLVANFVMTNGSL